MHFIKHRIPFLFLFFLWVFVFILKFWLCLFHFLCGKGFRDGKKEADASFSLFPSFDVSSDFLGDSCL